MCVNVDFFFLFFDDALPLSPTLLPRSLKAAMVLDCNGYWGILLCGPGFTAAFCVHLSVRTE